MVLEVTAVQERAWKQRGGVVRNILEREDGAGNTIECEAVGDGGNGYLHCALRHVTTGQVLDEVVIRPAAGMKMDSASAWVRGDRVRTRFGNHKPGEGDPEDLSVDRYDWYPEHLVPIPVGEPLMGREGGHPVTVVPEFTLQQVLDGVANLLGIGTMVPDNNLIGRLRPHIAEKMEQLFRPEDGSAVVWAQLLHTSYAGALEARRAVLTPAEADQVEAMVEAATVVLLGDAGTPV